MAPDSVAVVGAGVSGLTCAVLLAERGHRTVIFADKASRETTSAAAGAIWFPYDAEPAEKVIAWALETYRTLENLAQDGQSGVSIIELRTFARCGEHPIPVWAETLGAQRLPKKEIPAVFKTGWNLTIPLTDTTIYLDYLASRFLRAGGEIRTPIHFDKLEEIDGSFDLIVNCAAIGARDLVKDKDLEPHRGQVVIVPKLDVPGAIVCDDAPLMYVIPRHADCLFGGTNDVSDSLKPNPETTTQILAECSRVLGIDSPTVIDERVGLRPYRRSGVRLEAGEISDGRPVIHNYGHGGAGFTLSWGCAHSVAAILSQLANR